MEQICSTAEGESIIGGLILKGVKEFDRLWMGEDVE